jgi:septin 2
LKAAVPYAVIGSNTTIDVRGKKVRGRQYPWGIVEIENPNHCDFIKLRTMLITYMQDLKEVTQDFHYENYRAQRLHSPEGSPMTDRKRSNQGSTQAIGGSGEDEKSKMLREKEAELKRMQEMLEAMKLQMQQQQ